MKCKAGSQDVLAIIEEAGFDISQIKGFIHSDLPVTHSFTNFGPAIKDDANPIVVVSTGQATRGV